jgi:hypothetical protein
VVEVGEVAELAELAERAEVAEVGAQIRRWSEKWGRWVVELYLRYCTVIRQYTVR